MRARELGLCGLLVSGCTTEAFEAPRPEPTWFGTHLVVGVDEATVCAGSFEAMDRNVGRLKSIFGSTDDPLTVYLLTQQQMSAHELCGGPGCTIEDEVWATWVPASHELVHGTRSIVEGWDAVEGAAPALEEGLAEVLGDRVEMSETAPIEALFDGSPYGPGHYQRAGHFVRYLVDAFSLQSVREVVALSAGVGLEGAFVRGFGVTLDAVLEGYADVPECERDGWRIPVLECAGAPEPWSERWGTELVELSARLDCDGDAIGPRFGRVYRTWSIEVREAGDYWLSATHDPEFPADAFTVRLSRCDASCAEPSTTVLSNAYLSSHASLPLRAGTYFIEVDRALDAEDLPPIDVRLERLR